MKKIVVCILLCLLGFGITSMTSHKYYVGVFLMEHVPEKKVVRMTARVFVDDMDTALTNKYKRKFYLGSEREAPDATEYIKKYFLENIDVKLDGKVKALKFLGKELEDDILVCYYRIPAEGKIKKAEVKNTLLFDYFQDQQNYIHVKINGNKKSLLLTNDEQKGSLDF